MAQPYAPGPGYQPYVQSSYPSPYMAAPYTADPPGVAAQPPISEEALREKINSKIESIMDSHRSEVLSSQIERLTDKVGRLSRDLKDAQARPCAAPASLASYAHPSDYTPVSSHAPITSPNPSSSYYDPPSLSSPERDDELNRRLKRLAAESSRQLRQRF